MPDFFGSVNSSLHANFHFCPTGYCCNRKEGRAGCSIGFCENNRIGTLCGRCKEGTGLRFFESGCFEDDSCDDIRWFAAALSIMGFAFALYLVLDTGRPNDNTLETPLFFYQVVSLVKTTPWVHTLPAITVLFQSVANQSPSESSSFNWKGICLYPSMNQAQKLGGNLLFKFSLFLK